MPKPRKPRTARPPKPDGDALRTAGLALPLCVLPTPQPRRELPDELPGPPGWSGDGMPPGSAEPPTPEDMELQAAFAEIEAEADHDWWIRRDRLPALSDGPRDVRRGDCWLPWHFLPPKG